MYMKVVEFVEFKERLEQSFGRAAGIVESWTVKSLKAAQKDSSLAGALQEMKPVGEMIAPEVASVQIFLVITVKCESHALMLFRTAEIQPASRLTAGQPVSQPANSQHFEAAQSHRASH